MEFYAPAARVVDKIELDMKGNTHQQIALVLALQPQAGNASCTPDTDLPTEAFATGATPVVGTNPYYVILETAAT